MSPGTLTSTETSCGVVLPPAHAPITQLAGHVSGGLGCTLGSFSSTVLPSSHVSPASTTPSPQTVGNVVVEVVDSVVVVDVVVEAGAVVVVADGTVVVVLVVVTVVVVA